MKVVLSAQANRDLRAQVDWLASPSTATALKGALAIRSGLKVLETFPMAGVAATDGERKWLIDFGRGGYVVLYRVEPGRVIVGRILHARQDR